MQFKKNRPRRPSTHQADNLDRCYAEGFETAIDLFLRGSQSKLRFLAPLSNHTFLSASTLWLKGGRVTEARFKDLRIRQRHLLRAPINSLHGPLWQRLVADVIRLECQECGKALR